jgi:hypothetical protein
MKQPAKKLSRVLSLGIMILICSISLVSLVYADENETANMTADNNNTVVDEVVIVAVLEQSNANATQIGEIIAAAKEHTHANQTAVNNTSAELKSSENQVEADVLHSLLDELAVNETVTKLVEEFAATSESVSNNSIATV